MLQNRWQLKNTRYVELRGNGSIWKYWKTPKTQKTPSISVTSKPITKRLFKPIDTIIISTWKYLEVFGSIGKPQKPNFQCECAF